MSHMHCSPRMLDSLDAVMQRSVGSSSLFRYFTKAPIALLTLCLAIKFDDLQNIYGLLHLFMNEAHEYILGTDVYTI